MPILKKGLWIGSNFTVFPYETVVPQNVIEEPDGSKWLQIFHHVNPTDNLFAQTDSFTEGVYKSDDVWFNMNLCNLFTSWELLIMQKPTAEGTLVKYRWIQPANPMTCVFGDVDAADITKILTDGYSDMQSNQGGLYKKTSSTYLCQNNSNSGNWWGAVGAWANWNGGIPAINNTTVKDGYLDIYIRIDTGNYLATDKTKIYKKDKVEAVDFMEI